VRGGGVRVRVRVRVRVTCDGRRGSTALSQKAIGRARRLTESLSVR
tara:strand:+ start:530 stop:667 length:138 start_codon:yes stop_codon:yes gene_type:complete